MSIPLLDFMRVSESSFFTDTKARRDEYFTTVGSDYDTYEEKNIDGEQGIYFFDADRSNALFLRDSENYMIHCYVELERSEMIAIKKNIYTILDIEKSKVFVRNVVGELKHISNKVRSLALPEHLKIFQDEVDERLQNFIHYLEGSYLEICNPDESLYDKSPKIRWESNVKVLATLFFDLLHGQEKITKQGEPKRRLKPLIKASATDIQKLLIDNFIDNRGKALSPSTLETYFNSSKDTRTKNSRIELDYDV